MKIRKLGPEKSEIETVFLHGFPSLRSEQNTPIVDQVSAQLGRTIYQMFYAGLGKAEGRFVFSECAEEVQKFFREKISANPNIKFDVVGHSWGGFLAALVTSEFTKNIRKLVLLSPLVEFSKAELSKDSLAYLSALNSPNANDEEAQIVKAMPYKFDLGDTTALSKNFDELGVKYPWSNLVGKFNPNLQTMILQASDDTVTPREYIEAQVPNFPKATHFEVVKNVHSFLEDRLGTSKRIADFLK